MKKIGAFVLVTVALVFMVFVAIGVGSVKLPLSEILLGLIRGESGTIGIIRDIRLPRICIAILVGANLSVAGVMLQAVMRNPLADPGITGISTGASVVAMIVMLYVPSAVNSLPFFGFIGGFLACILIYGLAWKNGISAIRIVLAGVAVNAVLGGVNGMLSILNSDKLSGVLSWLNGSIANKSWSDVRLLAIYTVLGIIASIALYRQCNLLALGDKAAKSLGMNVNCMRIIISAVGVFLAGISTAIVGVIGFVGLAVPHISRMIVGSDHKRLIPFSAIMGAFILVLADTVGRTIMKPYEIPVGIVMAILGGPFFLYLLRKGDQNYGS